MSNDNTQAVASNAELGGMPLGLVARLRATPNWLRESWGSWKDCVTKYDRAPFDAADEIERLRSKLDEIAEIAHDSNLQPGDRLQRISARAQVMTPNAELDPLAGPVTLDDVLDALNLFNRPKPSEDDGPWEGGHFIRVDYLPDFINIIATAWFSREGLRIEERERCAKACETQATRWTDERAKYVAHECAAALRA